MRFKCGFAISNPSDKVKRPSQKSAHRFQKIHEK